MRICRRCGVYAPPECAVCDACNTTLRDHGGLVPDPRYRCASVRLEWGCGDCGAWTPVDGLPDDGAVVCGACGAERRLADEVWGKLLDQAHAVADLLGEHPEGFETSPVAIDEVNPFAAISRRIAGVRFAADEADAVPNALPRDLRLYVAPGRPLSGDDADPLELTDGGEGRLGTRASDGARGRYAVHPRYLRACPSLVGAVGHDHRADRPEASIGADWVCPSCGAALSRKDGTRYLVRCRSCQAVAAVPARIRHRGAPDPQPETWWLVFDGPSVERRALEREPGASARSGDRPLEWMPLVASTPSGRALRVVYVAVVPLVLLAIAGLVSRWPMVISALTGN